jgi:ribosomal protein S18 acetylase RimI-like enzyme
VTPGLANRRSPRFAPGVRRISSVGTTLMVANWSVTIGIVPCSAGSTVLVATDMGGAVVGSVLPGHDGHRGWLYYVAVAPALQGTGLGRALVRAGEEWLRGAGVAKVMLMVRTSNAQVRGFYDRLGYDEQDVAVLGRWIDGSR